MEFNASTTFREQVETMASTGVYISVHTSNLANTPFLQPGSAVFEIIQRNWIWENLDKSFKVRGLHALPAARASDLGVPVSARSPPPPPRRSRPS